MNEKNFLFLLRYVTLRYIYHVHLQFAINKRTHTHTHTHTERKRERERERESTVASSSGIPVPVNISRRILPKIFPSRLLFIFQRYNSGRWQTASSGIVCARKTGEKRHLRRRARNQVTLRRETRRGYRGTNRSWIVIDRHL